MNKLLPEYVKKLLWDVNTDTLDLKKYADYVIEKILFLGDIEATKWAVENYGVEKMIEVAKKSKVIRPAVKSFYLHLNQ